MDLWRFDSGNLLGRFLALTMLKPKPFKLMPLLALLLASACAPVTKTQVYQADIDSKVRTVSILPFDDRTSEGGLGKDNLINLQEQLADELEAKAAFEETVATTEHDDIKADAIVRNAITLFDISSRRVVVKTEVVSTEDSSVLAKFVTVSELVSVVWPIDYIGALEQSSDAIVSQIATSLSSSRSQDT